MIAQLKAVYKHLRDQRGGFLGIENNFAALAISAVAFGALVVSIPPGVSYAEVWRCKTNIENINLAGEQYRTTDPNHKYPGGGTAIAVTNTAFENPVTSAMTWLPSTPIDLSAPTGKYMYTGVYVAGVKTITITDPGNHDPSFLSDLSGATATTESMQYTSTAGDIIAGS